MNADRFTVKSREAIDRAQRIARDRSHQELRPEHLLAALLEDRAGTVVAVLQKLGVTSTALATSVESALGSLPRVQGGNAYLGEALRSVLDRAETHAERLKDEFVSVEHLLLAMADARACERRAAACWPRPA
jgi:ATP-dependent Clp protease ATP-binding subunit ClpB